MARLAEKYKNEISKSLFDDLGVSSKMEVPKVLKIVISSSVGAEGSDKKVLEEVLGEVEAISGQKPVVSVARKSIAAFKTRKGYPVGCKVTLRGERMYEFLDKFINVVLPRIRDFRGVSAKSFDGKGNLNFGIADQSLFFELPYEKISKTRGFDISFVTSAKSDEQAIELFKRFNLPIQ